MKISEIEALANVTAKYIVVYIGQTDTTEGKWESITDESGATSNMTAPKAFDLANKLVEYQNNAVNIKIKRKEISSFGENTFTTVFVGKSVDVSAWVLTGSEL